MVKWLVTGAKGLLGSNVVAALDGEPLSALGRDELDITDRGAVEKAISTQRPDVVVNTAADKNADRAEKDPVTADATNAVAPGYLAEACARNGALLIHISADYVFDGRSHQPYREDDLTRPLQAYGRSKRAGELAVLERHADAMVVRTSWLFAATGRNFVSGILAAERKEEILTVVDDQTSAPTWTRSFANAIIELARLRPPGGIYHCSADGTATWFDLATAVFEEVGADPGRLRAITTESLGLPAPRPPYSVLSNAKWEAAGLPRLAHWREDLARALRQADR